MSHAHFMLIVVSFTGKRRLAAVAVRRPAEFVDRWKVRRELQQSEDASTLVPRRVDPFDAVHAALGVKQCEQCEPEFRATWEQILGRVADSSYHDAGATLAIAVWVVTRHTRPERAVESGVAHGVTSACILEAMERNGAGHLWSIDLPPLSGDWLGSTGVAVGKQRARWTYVRGSVDRHLAPLLVEVETLDLYVHDALHTYRAMTGEFGLAWPRLSVGSVLISDDVQMTKAFEDFDFAGGASLVLADEDKGGAIGLVVKRRAVKATALVTDS